MIEELKMSKDITGIKKLKVERARRESLQDKETFTEFTKRFTAENFVEQVSDLYCLLTMITSKYAIEWIYFQSSKLKENVGEMYRAVITRPLVARMLIVHIIIIFYIITWIDC